MRAPGTWYRIRPPRAKILKAGTMTHLAFGGGKKPRWVQLPIEDVRVCGALSDLVDGTAQVYVRNHPELIRL